jgi:hypothetical protein
VRWFEYQEIPPDPTSIHIQVVRNYATAGELLETVLRKYQSTYSSTHGMMTIAAYGEARRGWSRLPLTDEGKAALVQVLRFALKRISTFPPNYEGNLPSQAAAISPFPPESVMFRVLEIYLGLHSPYAIKFSLSSGDVQDIWDMPLYSIWHSLYKNTEKGMQDSPIRLSYLLYIQHLAADIFAIALAFNEATPPLIFNAWEGSDIFPNSDDTDWAKYVRAVIEGKPVMRIDVATIVRVVTEMLGQGQMRVSDELYLLERRVVSARRGQVLVPSLLVGHDLRERGFLSFVCLPGVLSVGNRQFDIVQGPPLLSRPDAGHRPRRATIVAHSNLFAETGTAWLLTPREDHLQVEITWEESYPEFSLSTLHQNLCDALVCQPCMHDFEEVREADVLSPVDTWSSLEAERPVYIYPLFGAPNLQILPLATARRFKSISNREERFILNQGACLACVTKLCKDVDFTHVIL